jgi:transposase
MLVEAAFAAARVPGPLRAFHERVRARRGLQIAIVATARKLAVLCWHLIAKGEDYAFQRPSLTAKKLRALELRAACLHAAAAKAPLARQAPTRSGRSAGAKARSPSKASTPTAQLVANWQSKAPVKAGAGAATGERL